MAETEALTSEAPYRPILAVYVVWHPDSTRGGELARALFNELTSGIDIPVFFRSAPAGKETPTPLRIPFDAAQRNVVFVMADSSLALACDDGFWGDYVSDLVRRPEGASHRLIPVLLDSSGTGFGQQAIRVRDRSAELQETFFLSRALHELCRLLIGDGNRPIKLFISHAKADGLDRAREIERYIKTETVFDAFFDANEIIPGHLFDQDIEASLQEATLLVLLTDAYATRPWCRREVLVAKRHGRPVVVVHAVHREESRCFPYLGNTPVLRIDRPDEPWETFICEKVLHATLREVLRQTYLEHHLTDLVGESSDDIFVVPRPPELLTSLFPPVRPEERGQKRRIGIYPDPPLGDEELEILSRLEPDVVWITPTMLSLLQRPA